MKIKRIPTHQISAVTYESGETDLTWDDLETGEHFGVTIKLTKEQCQQLAKVVPPCVVLDAVNSLANTRERNAL